MHPTIKIVLRAQDTKKGRPVVIRVWYANTARYIRLRIYCAPADWDSDKARFRRTAPDYRRQNDLLAAYEARAADILFDWARTNTPFDFDRFEKVMFAGAVDKSKPLVVDYLKTEQAAMESAGRQSYAHLVGAAISTVEGFQRAKRKKYTLSDVTPEWVEDLDAHVAKATDMGNGWRTVFSILRACLNRARKVHKMGANWKPFEGFVSCVESTKPAKRAISLAELRALIETPAEDEFQGFSKDLFLLSFYLWGANLADICELTRDSIVDGRVVYRRRKTGREYSVALSPKAGAILDRYRNQGKYLIPIYRAGMTPKDKYRIRANMLDKINEALRAVAHRAGINPKRFTFYVARHTFATALKRAGFSHGLIQDALGHSDANTTNAYLDSFEVTALDSAAEKVMAELG